MDKGAWLAIVHGVAKSRTRLSDEAQQSTWTCSVQERAQWSHCTDRQPIERLTELTEPNDQSPTTSLKPS